MSDETQYHELNESEEQARRLLDITLTLVSRDAPVSSTRIRETHYPNVTPDSFRRQFNRDRQRLALCGIVVRRTNRPPDEPLWAIDQNASFVSGDKLDPREAVLLDVACSRLASDPSFPYGDDLRIALGKVDRAFDQQMPIQVLAGSRKRDKATAVLERCALVRHAIDVSYVRTDGASFRRRIGIYGMFSLRGHAYVVGPRLHDSGEPETGSIRTYRIDRFTSCREDKSITYRIPADFNINDYVLLPFQIGKTMYYATFYVPQNVLSDVLKTVGSRGDIVAIDGRDVLRVAVSSEHDAACWAIDQGLIPLSPDSLVRAWDMVLGDTLAAQGR